MNDSFAWWLVIAGVAIGVGLAWLILGRLPRTDDDLSTTEREAEAAWISSSIALYGGDAPEPLVEEILELHRHYLETPPARATAEGYERLDPADIDDAPDLGSAREIEAIDAVEAHPARSPRDATVYQDPL
ncbi:MAG: hypothetical protein H0V36_02675 [Chloroflexi bacterium]|nr:hypothetical protein [Chloroflexota bacterium]